MLGIGLIICAVMFVGMLAIGGPHHMTDIQERVHKTVQTDHGRGQISGGGQQVMHGGHGHIGTDTDRRDEDKEEREP